MARSTVPLAPRAGPPAGQSLAGRPDVGGPLGRGLGKDGPPAPIRVFWIPSGNEWITSAGLAASKPPAEPKISAAEAIRTGQVRMGSPTCPKATRAQLNRKPGASAAGIPLMGHKNIQVSEQ
ncbi:hypothetical protein [Streptomyces sp. Ncost-T10-10d]|uniref:hypothetical protein n=1 Tax=Streptomyces sp. Ncost-T10-10d TaxID=1839774 RepID=UPI00081F6E31|nr:hypothetical protein [Streptomyces sp. Ncost-T10-10d]SCF56509.1 hypothetical protein GA0115254_100719 [Streptomyces sp. Ncost-T10-10d]